MRMAFSTVDAVQAALVRLTLIDSEIDFFMDNDYAANWNTDLGSPAAPIVFQVRDSDFKSATAAIRRVLARLAKKKKAAGKPKKAKS